MLTGQAERDLNTALSLKPGACSIDRSEFADRFEDIILQLDELTQHQRKILGDMTNLINSDVHLTAPAGAGKTFVAVHLIRDRLMADQRASVLFAAPNISLCYLVVRWLNCLIANPVKRSQVLKRVYVAYGQLEHPSAVSSRRKIYTAWVHLIT